MATGGHYLISFVLVALVHGEARAGPAPFRGRSFALRATVALLDMTGAGQRVLWSRTEERYSGDQLRASIKFAARSGADGELESGRLYHDSARRQTLAFNGSSCQLVGANQVRLVPNLDLSQLELDEPSDHVIGPARLMLFVEQHKDQLKMASLSPKIRNLATLAYTYKLDQEIGLNIYYSGLALSESPDSMPMQIVVSKEQQLAFVDFSQVRLEEANQDVADPDQVHLDNHAYPKECASQIESKWTERLFQKPLDRFSFVASIASSDSARYQGRPLVSKINYYHDLDTISLVLKVDSESGISRHKMEANFKTKRAYQVVEEMVKGEGAAGRDCLLFKISSRDGKQQSISEILTGADKFVYLGRAKVRGTKTSLYAAVETTMPAWLEQPVEYSYMETSRVRDPLSGADNSLVTLIYLTNDKQILQMELHKPNGLVTIELFDFIWDLERSTTPSELFSLHQDCSNTDESKHARVELLLGKLDGVKFSQPPSHSILESRLLAILQEHLFIPATMVYDLEVKVLKEKDLFATFNVAAHGEGVVDLIYLGQGSSRWSLIGGVSLFTDNFQMCFQLAVRQQRPLTKIFFGYNVRTKSCRLALDSDDFTLSNENTQDRHDEMEIYAAKMVKRNVMVYGGQDGRWLEGSGRDWYRSKYLGARVVLNASQEFNRYSWFQVRQFKVKTLGGLGLPDRINIRGFGLVESEQAPRIGLESGMTLSECRSHCLASDSCRSYSVCQRARGLECILSPFNFQSANTLMQLAQATNSSSAKVSVILDDETRVDLRRQLSCDLYNKLYMDLFEPGGKSWMSLHSHRRIMAVTGEEECAKVCVQSNVKVLSDDVELRSKLATWANSDDFDETMASRKENSDHFCSGFLYMDRSQVDDEEKLKKILKLSEEDLKLYAGYCSLEVAQSVKENDATSPRPQALVDSIRFGFTRFKFNLIHFYESQRGVRLLAGQISPEDKAAYYLAQRQRLRSLSKTAYDRLRLLAESGNNFQEANYMDELKCASVCFFGKLEHLLGPWPLCQSFDVFHDERSDRKQCFLNSISLKGAVNSVSSNYIDDSTGNQSTWTSWTHYEPSFLLSHLAETTLRAELELEEGHLFGAKSAGAIGGLALVVLSWAAVLGGLLVGAKLGQRFILIQLNSHHIEHDRVELSFSNQVNDHDAIVD